MAAATQPSPSNSYVATEVFHYPDGVAMPGDIVTLDPDDAERGVAAGVLFPTPTPEPVDETDPEIDPVSVAPDADPDPTESKES
jgi:hypothetical protein